jgi:hypothetical protein
MSGYSKATEDGQNVLGRSAVALLDARTAPDVETLDACREVLVHLFVYNPSNTI